MNKETGLQEKFETLGYPSEFAKMIVKNYVEKIADELMDVWKEEERQKFKTAVLLAAKAHVGDVRKGTDIPYFIHPMEAALIALDMTEDSDIICGAVLHDVVEDTEYTVEDIKLQLNERIAELVGGETENKRPDKRKEDTWKIRKEEFLNHLQQASKDSKIITMSDKLSNMRALHRDFQAIGDELWQRFNQKDTKLQEWYYREIAERTKSELKDTQSWKEYVQLCDLVFSK